MPEMPERLGVLCILQWRSKHQAQWVSSHHKRTLKENLCHLENWHESFPYLETRIVMCHGRIRVFQQGIDEDHIEAAEQWTTKYCGDASTKAENS